MQATSQGVHNMVPEFILSAMFLSNQVTWFIVPTHVEHGLSGKHPDFRDQDLKNLFLQTQRLVVFLYVDLSKTIELYSWIELFVVCLLSNITPFLPPISYTDPLENSK